jgi:hypothetical protein
MGSHVCSHGGWFGILALVIHDRGYVEVVYDVDLDSMRFNKV